MSFDFLKSNRFWSVVIIALLAGLQKEGFLLEGSVDTIVNAIQLVLGGHVVIRTVDRAGETIGNR